MRGCRRSWIVAVRGAAIIATMSAAPRAHASPIYPGIVASVVGAPHSPPCTVCHETPSGGLGTATKPLAVYLRSRGLVANDEGSLRNALAAAAAEKHDSDGDGVSDVDELKAGTDPNVVGTDALAPPEYGCGGGNNISGSRSTNNGFMAAFALAYLCVARRRCSLKARAKKGKNDG